jgi:3-dehydroquinate dehydratase-2
MKKIAIINGPNLNLLGERQPDIYGYESFDLYFETLKKKYRDLKLSYYQSNIEGEIINELHRSKDFDGIVLNAGGFTHTSVAIADAVAAIKAEVAEVHISNIYSREPFRSKSYISIYAIGIISGFGLKGYDMALEYLSGIK